MAIRHLVEAVRAELETDTGIDWIAGNADLEGGISRRSRGYVRVEGFARSDDNALWEVVDVRARLYAKYVEPRSDEEPINPADIYDLAEILRDALANRRRLTDSTGQVWLLSFRGVDIDHDAQGVEATLAAGRENPFELVETTG
jgi:hypothetical protein